MIIVLLDCHSLNSAQNRIVTNTAKENAMKENPDDELERMFHRDVSASTFFAVRKVTTDYKFDYNATQRLVKKFNSSLFLPNRYRDQNGNYRTFPTIRREFKKPRDIKISNRRSTFDTGTLDYSGTNWVREVQAQVYNKSKSNETRRNMPYSEDARRFFFNTKFEYDQYMYTYGCMMISNSYANAFEDLRKYFPIRILYQENLEYEVGYLTYHIVHKYQSVLEVFHLAFIKFDKNRDTDKAPVNYMFYLYRVIAETCKVIIHLCNMMHEMKRKYFGHKTVFTIWDRKPTRERKKRLKIKKINKAVFDSHKAGKKQERKDRERELEHGLVGGAMFSSTRKPRKGSFPLNYGWSIEDWWLD